jgi:hypothetical protein
MLEFPEHPHILLTERSHDQGLRQLQQAGYLDREVEITRDACRAFHRLNRAANTHVNVAVSGPLFKSMV